MNFPAKRTCEMLCDSSLTIIDNIEFILLYELTAKRTCKMLCDSLTIIDNI